MVRDFNGNDCPMRLHFLTNFAATVTIMIEKLEEIKLRYEDVGQLLMQPAVVNDMKKFMELRICELWTEVAPGAEKMAQKAIRKLIRHTRPALVSCAASPLFSDKKRPATFFGPFKKGPVITIRPLAKNNLNNFEQFSHWQPSLGSMELF